MSSSQNHKSLLALTSVLETSAAALVFLDNPSEGHDPSLDGSNLAVLHKDFLSLLSLIHGSITKTSLVLKPSSPSYAASLEPLKELKDRVAALPYCVRLLQTDHGKTLAAEATNITKEILDGVTSLIQTFIAIDSEGSSSSGEAGDEYMVRTGTVHEIIDRARGQDGFSGNNLAAVRKIMKRNQESLDDGVDEVRETLEKAESPGADEEDDFDDGWGELGISSNAKPSATELERTKQIYAIVRLSTLLHQRVYKDVLSPLPPSKDANAILDGIAKASSDLLVFSDNFISTMYPPQVPEHISIELEAYQHQLSIFRSNVDPLINETSIEAQLQNLQITHKTKGPDYAKLRKWYITCVNQINKSIHELEHELKGPETPLA